MSLLTLSRRPGGPHTSCDTVMTRTFTEWITRDVKRTRERLLVRWSDFFTKALNKGNAVPSFPEARTIQCSTMVVTSGPVTDVRSSKSMINGTTGGTGDDLNQE
uniref:Uncharacterized protein n=1 Tax=Haemonchus contortus TaxID=6289 RepID=A0A7I4YD03_HAECO